MPAAGTGHVLVRRYIDAKRGRVTDAVALEGTWALRAALDADVPIEGVLRSLSLARGDDGHAAVAEAATRGATVLDVAERVLHRMVDRAGPDGIASLARPRTWSLVDVTIHPTARVVVADACDLPGNLGTIIRCADGAGARAVLQTDGRVRRHHPLVVKASMGTVLSMPVVDATRDDARAWLRANGVR